MNLDFALTCRALLNAGLEKITLSDKAADNEAWRTAKAYYLQTMLEALERVEWTGAKRRRELTPASSPCVKNRDFAYVYDLPYDCVKPIELDGREYFAVEGFLVYSDANPARLLYITSGRKMRRLAAEAAVISGGNANRNPHAAPEFIAGGDANRSRRLFASDGSASAGDAERESPSDPDDDFPDYWTLHLENNFYLYWENLLTAKFALRLTGKPEMAAYFAQQAQAIGRQAEIASSQRAASRRVAPPTWQEALGAPPC